MEVILLERIAKLGQIGDTVTVKGGFARNFLLPQNKALRATPANKVFFSQQKTQLEATNLKLKIEAEAVKEKIVGTRLVIIRAASEKGQLYGSVSSRDISLMMTEEGTTITHSQVSIPNQIKTLGIHDIDIILHPEVTSLIKVNVARSQDEAKQQEAEEQEENLAAQNISEAEKLLSEIEVSPEQVAPQAEPSA